jgi:hypothetical protein
LLIVQIARVTISSSEEASAKQLRSARMWQPAQELVLPSAQQLM